MTCTRVRESIATRFLCPGHARSGYEAARAERIPIGVRQGLPTCVRRDTTITFPIESKPLAKVLRSMGSSPSRAIGYRYAVVADRSRDLRDGRGFDRSRSIDRETQAAAPFPHSIRYWIDSASATRDRPRPEPFGRRLYASATRCQYVERESGALFLTRRVGEETGDSAAGPRRL